MVVFVFAKIVIFEGFPTIYIATLQIAFVFFEFKGRWKKKL